MDLHFLLHSEKNPKWKYYLKAYCREMVPAALLRAMLNRTLRKACARADFDYMMQRVNYYCKLLPGVSTLPADTPTIGTMKRCRQKVYWFDSREYLRWFKPTLRVSLLPGDINYVPENQCIVKSRSIGDDNANGTLLNMDKVRHFIFVHDSIPFAAKQNRAVFRGKIGTPGFHSFKPQRYDLLKRFWGHPLLDMGEIASKRGFHTEEWLKPKMTIGEHLQYKFVLSIEGNDVASNLKWIMSSNSIAVMPRPTCETWFMEGTLRPNYHYIEVQPDFSDLIEKIEYYSSHIDEAEEIIQHAHEYVAQFQDKKRERLISLLTLEKYIQQTNLKL